MSNDNAYLHAVTRRRLKQYSTHVFRTQVALMRAEAVARMEAAAARVAHLDQLKQEEDDFFYGEDND